MVVGEGETVISARIPLIHDAVLGHLAKQEGVSRSELVRRAISLLIDAAAESEAAEERVRDGTAVVGHPIDWPEPQPPRMTLIERAFLDKVMEDSSKRERETERLVGIFRRIREAIDEADYDTWEQ